MSPEQLAAVHAEVNGVANLIGSGATMAFGPEALPFVLIGKGVAAVAPDLINDVEQWIANAKAGKDPTPEENAALASKIATLFSPETL